MDILILAGIGFLTGTLGGFLGIGGSVIMIPAMVFVYGENQHLYQASAMICNFFVAIAAVFIHHRADALVMKVIKWMVPLAGVGIILGVFVSNTPIFAKEKSYLLARVFGLFMVFVVVYNLARLIHRVKGAKAYELSNIRKSNALSSTCGFLSTLPAGLLGIGGGSICVPFQQLLLKMPFKNAISNSAVMIACVSLIGAAYKNMTLSQHDISIYESLRIAACIIPTAFLGSIVGSKLLHRIHVNAVRVVFILMAAVAAYKMMTIIPGS